MQKARSNFRRHGLFSFQLVISSIQERHIPHRLRLVFRVQGDRGMIGVPDVISDN